MSAAVRLEVIDRVMFTRWTRPPTKQDVTNLLAEASGLRERLGSPLIYVASIDSRVKIPNAEERSNLNDLLFRGRTMADSAHIVIEGSDLQNSLQRVIISGMLIVTRTYDDYLAVHKTIDSVAPDLNRRLGKDPAPIIQLARERGLAV
ncbi:DofB protein [Hyalangium rubrum]|uniref:DofB protein n=1 Tax=Hyalangium rubrum TaxID=3103134 RepID=A0ABU5HE33_9BACT|nr:DofB protein [Hyalangium sp. s54d21]MDY7231741.1 DofB protein [Hyalangium sp. s54d21]